MKKLIIAILALATICLPNTLNAVNKESKRQIKTFGIIPKRIGGEWLQKDPKAAYTYMAQLGYKEIERNDNYGMTPKECKKMLDDLKLKTVIWGANIPDVADFTSDKTEKIDKAIADCKAAGAKYLACYGATQKYTSTIQGWKEWAELLNKVGEYCAKKGLKLIFHNHSIEFIPLEGQIPYDVLVPLVNPKFCNFELDIYWVIKGGSDPETVMKKYPGRFPVLHLKDMSHGENKTFEDMGYGIIDYKPIFRAAKIAGVKHFIIEHDQPVDSKRSIERGAEFFKNFRYSKLPFRISLNTSTIKAYNLSVPDQINAVADAGFDGIELWIKDVYKYLDEGGQIEDIAKLIKKRNLILENLIGHSTWLSSDPKIHEEGLAEMKRDIELASKLGSRCIAATGKGLTGWELTDIPLYGRQYAEILEYGKALGVRPIIELWGMRIMHRIWQVEAIALESGREDAGLLLDFYHLYRGNNPFSTLALIDIKQMPLIHLNDYPATPVWNELTDADRLFPGDGICPFNKILPMLVQKGFCGALSLELFNENYWKKYATAQELLAVAYEKCVSSVTR